MKTKKNKLIITWKPDVLTMVEHSGNTDSLKGLTARSEVESFKNVKTRDAADKILLSRNIRNIQVATYNGEVILLTVPQKKERKKFVKKKIKKPIVVYSNRYEHK